MEALYLHHDLLHLEDVMHPVEGQLGLVCQEGLEPDLPFQEGEE